ncbi:uncharacterized protein MONOS_11636 [Monocercomonoides exilis]|uniref:uncharacterized protein n=1 Tax=Monocercomonoides exilis TaxID=2049356 RepID=UPI00355A4093|nr:hypothetical protein MONOS_11636 [Monocercomonoides exilis]|eukprot:MONOS_11636.1-p1 / transcript=MONOS_11636.1 / gene=MONOS_11636 / organism=Monocercomonoides_exilis_PA203 / gene_product=unspecified product / transcript_product=unspecified product / location=Mono_scaffold00595:28966-30304(+) / protein_length=383 / sequence_SO=supercontig / SO=protein_coding / is_pseudo=false
MTSPSQFPPIVGLTQSADSAMQHSGAQSQPGTLSQQNIFSSSSIFSPSLPERLAQELTPSADRKENDDVLDISQLICQEISPRSFQDVIEEYSTQDLSPLLSLEQPAAKRIEDWINDALDQLAGILIMIAKALKEERTVRIQGRFGFRAATAMSTDASTGILTERQELILREARQEAKFEGGFQRPALPITRVQAPVREQPGTLQRRLNPPGPQCAQEDSNSEEDGVKAVEAGDQGGINNFWSSSQGDRAEEADRRKNSIVYLGMEANRRREIDKQWSAGHVEKQAVQESSQQSPVQRRSVASQPTKDRGIQENIRRTVTNRSCYPNGAEGGQTQKQCISHSKEVRQLDANSRLSETECSGEENTFLERWRENSGTADKTEG